MQQLPHIYNLESVTNINATPEAEYANREAKKQILSAVVVFNSEETQTKVTTYNVGVLTGLTAQSTDGITAVQYIKDNKVYWTTTDGLILGNTTTKYLDPANSKLKSLIDTDEKIIEDLLLAAEFVGRLEKKGYNCATYRQEIKNLYDRWQIRQEFIKGYSENIKTEQPQLLTNNLKNICSGESIGIAITTTIIITAVVTASFSAIAWYLFYTYSAQSKSDCRKSKELNKILANVDPETKEQLYNYIDKYADRFYKKAVARTKAENLFSNIKSVVLLVGGGYLVYYFLNKK